MTANRRCAVCAVTSGVLLVGVVVLTGCTLAALPTGKSATASASASASASPDAQPNKPDEPSGGPKALVTIASVDVDGLNVTVAGMVTGVIESGGTCDFTITSASTGAVVTASSKGIENVRTTSCGSVQVPIGHFARGDWKVVLNYQSEAAKVTSAPSGVSIP